MTDELDLLSSLNPIPEVRGNPGPVPVPSPGDLLAETGTGSGQSTATPSSHDEAAPRHRSGAVGDGRSGRSRWALGAIGVAAAVAVVVGIVAATGDDSGRGNQLITSVDDPPPAPDDGTVAEPDEPIPWPDPIVIEVTPENASDARIIEVPAGVVVLEIRGSGWEPSANAVFACESYEAREGGGFACRREVRTPLGDGGEFSRPLVLPGMRLPTTLLLQLNDPSGAGPLAVGTLVPVGEGAPTLMEPHVRSDSWGVGVVDRVELEARVAGHGWAPEPPIDFHVCASRPVGTLDAGDCAAIAASSPAADGTVDASIALPSELVGWAVQGSEFWLVGAQGSRLATMRYMVLGPRMEPGRRPVSLPSTVDVEIIDLRAGERAVVRTCGPSAACREPIGSVEVMGSGSGLDTVRVTIDENVDRLQLFVEGSIVADGIWFEEDPSPPGPNEPPASITEQTIPWPDPIVIEVTPETASADRIIEVSAALAVIEIRGSGWEHGANGVVACESYDQFENGGFSCRTGASRALGDVVEFSGEFILPGTREPTTLVVFVNNPPGAQSGTRAIEVATLMPTADSSAQLMTAGATSTSTSSGLVGSSTREAHVTGAGWTRLRPITFHVCHNPQDPIDPDDTAMDPEDCVAIGTQFAGDDGSFDAAVAIPAELFARDPRESPFWLLAAQGAQVATMSLATVDARAELVPRPDTAPATVEVSIIDLRADEHAELRTCPRSRDCEPIRTADVIGSGSGSDIVRLTIDEDVDRVQLFVEGSLVQDGIWLGENP